MDKLRRMKLQKETVTSVLYYLKDDLDGGELLMKETWEECSNAEEREVVKEEIRTLMELLRGRLTEINRVS